MSALQLSIDTCNKNCNIALSRGVGIDFDIIATDIIAPERGHAEVLVDQIAALMHRESFKPEQLDRVVATRGPGSFTGQRVGLSAARALAAALNIDVFGIGVLPALIFDAQQHVEEPSTKIAVIDARRDAVYLRADHPDGRAEDCILGLDAALQQIAYLAGPKYLVGSGAKLLSPRLANDVAVLSMDFPSIGAIAALGHRACTSDSPATPLYLRAPDAKPQMNTLLNGRSS